MVAKKRAICDAAIAIAEAYGPNVSKGILAMKAKIIELEKDSKRMKNDEVH